LSEFYEVRAVPTAFVSAHGYNQFQLHG
jgi:hypothetical protein